MGSWLFAFSGSHLEKDSPDGQVQIGGTHQVSSEDGHHCHPASDAVEVKPGGGFALQSRHCSHSILRKAQVDSTVTRVEPTRSYGFAAGVEVNALDAVSLSVAEERVLETTK